MTGVSSSKRASIVLAYGCPRSKLEVSRLYRYLERNGWSLTGVGKADIVFVSCCAVTDDTERKSLEMLRYIGRTMRSEGRLIMLGCMAGISRDNILEHLPVTLVPSKQISALDEIIDATIPLDEIDEYGDNTDLIRNAQRTISPWKRLMAEKNGKKLNWLFHVFREYGINYFGFANTPYLLRVANGCLDTCSYCAIRFASGELVSKPLDKVVEEMSCALDDGYTRIKLVGQDVGAFGQDIGTDFVRLLDALLEQEGDYTLIMNDLNMRWCVKYRDYLLPMFCKHADKFEIIGIPVQSGSDAVLGAMNRQYSAEESLDFFKQLKQLVPDVHLSSHVIVGFPGEAESDFARTLTFISEAQLDSVLVYAYSDRPHTEASTLPGKIDRSIIHERIKRLKSVCKANRLQYRVG